MSKQPHHREDQNPWQAAIPGGEPERSLGSRAPQAWAARRQTRAARRVQANLNGKLPDHWQPPVAQIHSSLNTGLAPERNPVTIFVPDALNRC